MKKNNQKRLFLSRETIKRLNTAQLAGIAGGVFTNFCPASKGPCPSAGESACTACTTGNSLDCTEMTCPSIALC